MPVSKHTKAILLVLCLNLTPLSLLGQEMTGIWEGSLQGGPGTLRVDFSSGAASLNGGPPLELTVLEDEGNSSLRFQVTRAGQVFTFVGDRTESGISGKLASWDISFSRLPDTTPSLVARKLYPFPVAAEAEAILAGRNLVEELVDNMEIPGLSIAVARDGVLVWAEGFGWADVEQRVPATEGTLFRVGSVSKVLTAAGLARLVEEGKLDLDAPVQRYVADFPVHQWPVTTRQLATHTAGIRHYDERDNDGPVSLRGTPHFASVRDGLEIFSNDSLLFEPGTDFHYSSYGWNLISAVMEGASGEEFVSFMQHRVFEPLGLRDIAPDHVFEVIPGRASFYAREAPGRKLEHAPYVDSSYKWASGGYLASTVDLARFGSAHLRPGFFREETLDLLFTAQSPVEATVGLGWRIGEDSGGRRFLHHAGAIEGGRAVLVVVPDTSIVVAIAANILAPFGVLEAYRIASLFVAQDDDRAPG